MSEEIIKIILSSPPQVVVIRTPVAVNPTIPVRSVNTKTGDVVLDHNDVGADQSGAAAAAQSNAESYAESLVVGLWDDRGNFDASGNSFPDPTTAAGSGPSHAILKGDIWTISGAGTLGGNAVTVGDTVRALTDTPGQTSSNWAIGENNIGYVPENSVNKDTDQTLGSNSDTKYPSQKAVKSYVDSSSSAAQSAAQSYAESLVVGLWDDRGNFNASGNAFPSSGGSGASGAILKGDIWTISVAGTLGGNAVTAGDTVRALTDTPGQTSLNWAIGENNIGYLPENSSNKDASGGYSGLTLFKINFKNALNTFISFFTNSNTAARTYTFQDRNGTIADDTDLALKANVSEVEKILQSQVNPGTGNSADTVERIIHSILIPANTFTTGDILDLWFQIKRTLGAASTFTPRVYVNTSNQISGATQIALCTNVGTGTIIIANSLIYGFISTTQVQRVVVTAAFSGDYIGQTGSALANFNFNTAVDNYLIITTKSLTGTNPDTTSLSMCIVKKLKAV